MPPIGVAQSFCYDRPKPTESGTGANGRQRSVESCGKLGTYA